MEKGFFYSGILLTIFALSVSEAVAGNPFNWEPYEHEESEDEGSNASSSQPQAEKHEE